MQRQTIPVARVPIPFAPGQQRQKSEPPNLIQSPHDVALAFGRQWDELSAQEAEQRARADDLERKLNAATDKITLLESELTRERHRADVHQRKVNRVEGVADGIAKQVLSLMDEMREADRPKPQVDTDKMETALASLETSGG